MSDGIRDVEPYDEITTWLEANGDVEENLCFYEWVQEGYPMVKETVLELTDEELMACYRIIEAEYSAQ